MKEGLSRQEEATQVIKAEARETTEPRKCNTRNGNMRPNVKNLALKGAKKDKSEEIDVLQGTIDIVRILIDELKIGLNYKYSKYLLHNQYQMNSYHYLFKFIVIGDTGKAID